MALTITYHGDLAFLSHEEITLPVEEFLKLLLA